MSKLKRNTFLHWLNCKTAKLQLESLEPVLVHDANEEANHRSMFGHTVKLSPKPYPLETTY